MDWQYLLTWVAIAAAAAFIGWRAWRLLRPTKDGCSGGCGCAKSPSEAKTPSTLIAPEQLTLRQRPGNTP